MSERRQYQRLHLTQPLDGWFGDYSVRLVDVSASGALIEADEEIPADSRALLRFFWRGQEVEVTAETARSEDDLSGLTFVEESEVLRTLIAAAAEELLRAQQANVSGDREFNILVDETLTAASAGLRGSGFVTYTFENGQWSRRKSLLPDQPPNGFTIATGAPAEQIEMLCRTFEAGDPESQRMTRMLAELSVTSVKA